MSFSKSQRLPSVETSVSRSFSGPLSTTTSASGKRSRPQSAGSCYAQSQLTTRSSTANSCSALRVTSRQPQPQKFKRPPPVHVWNYLEDTTFTPTADRWCTQVTQTGEADTTCSLPISLVTILRSMWQDSVARGKHFLCVLETCHNCEDHARTTKHKVKKYNTYSGDVADMVAQEFSFIGVEQMHLSRHYFSAKKAPRRLGACEVYLLMPDGPDNSQSCSIYLGHSKLATLRWPNLSNLKTRLLSVMPSIVRRVLQMRSQDWSVLEGQAVMKEAQAWGLERWDALEGLADKVDAGNRVLESGQKASANNDKDALREAIHDCHELQLADELIGGWMDELKQKNMNVFGIKLQAKRFQRNAAFAAAARALHAATLPPLRLSVLQRALVKAQNAELPEADVAEAAELQSRVEEAVHRLAEAAEKKDLFELAEGVDEVEAMEVEDDVLSSSKAEIEDLACRVGRAGVGQDFVGLEDALGSWRIRDVDPAALSGTAAGVGFRSILEANKVRMGLQKQVNEAEKRFQEKRWDALKSSMERLKDVHIQEETWERWRAALTREQHWMVLRAVSGAAVELKRQLYTRRLEAALQAPQISLTQLEEAASAAEANQADASAVQKARAEVSTARQRWRDAQDAMDKRIVDRADVMVWKLKKGRVRMDEWNKREGPLWDLVDAIQEAEGTQDWQAMQAAIAGWQEERPDSNHEAFEDSSSPTRLFRGARQRTGELRLRQLRQEVNDILNSFKDPGNSLPPAEAKASLKRAAQVVREMLKLGWEMTPARNARLLLALGKATAEGGREVSLARFAGALLQMAEGSPDLVFVLDCSGAKRCGMGPELEQVVGEVARSLRREVAGTGGMCSAVAYTPASVIQERGSDPPGATTLASALASAVKSGEAEVTQAFRSAKELLKRGKKSAEQAAGDRQQVLVHLSASVPGSSKDVAKTMKVLEALGVTVLGLGFGDVKVDTLMKMSSPGLAFKVEAAQLAKFVQDGCQEVERVLKASQTEDPEDILHMLEAGAA